MAIPCGAFVDRAGLKLSLFLAALIMALSGLLRALSYDYFTMFSSVALFGIGGPLISIGAPKLIADYFVGKESLVIRSGPDMNFFRKKIFFFKAAPIIE